ncbi:hypothetical protein [Sphingomonas lacusdianchii]|uniref:hypothetical protein n=1 Tax=Sphingomonas lacusdianchii TaxID=2917992 RepID=UPI001F5700C5|nr:hypothetical protein [Sphingomonas sp. JXJ CY 53]
MTSPDIGPLIGGAILSVLTAILIIMFIRNQNLRRARLARLARAGRTQAKPRVRVVARGGWIRHDGGPFPFDPVEAVEVIFEGGGLSERTIVSASYWPEQWWQHQALDRRYNILFYRFAQPLSVRNMPSTELPA